MSPSWRDRLRIGLCPDRVLLAAYRRGMRPRLLKAEAVVLAAPDAPSWKAALDALPALIAGAGVHRPQITVVLSNHFVRYAVLPPNPALKNDETWQALARHRFASVHGPVADVWTVRLSRRSFGGTRVAAAIDTALLDGLERVIHESGAMFESAQPYLMAVFNRVCSAIGKDACWLMVEEPGRLTLALMIDGSWRVVRSRRADAAWPENLRETLERESAVAGLDQPCIEAVLCAMESPDRNFGDVRVRDLTLQSGAAGDHRLAMILA